MKNILTIFLICLFVFHSIAYALPFDEQKLLQLKPLLSARIDAKARQVKDGKIWPALTFGLLGGALIGSNLNETGTQNGELYRWANLMYGLTALLTGIDLYYEKQPIEMDQEILNSASQPGIEREKIAYAFFSKKAEEGRQFRATASFIWTGAGIGFALVPLLTPNAVSGLKSSSMAAAVLFCGLGLYNYFFPTADEQDLQKIEAELNQ
jgi:hypothetical protein